MGQGFGTADFADNDSAWPRADCFSRDRAEPFRPRFRDWLGAFPILQRAGGAAVGVRWAEVFDFQAATPIASPD